MHPMVRCVRGGGRGRKVPSIWPTRTMGAPGFDEVRMWTSVQAVTANARVCLGEDRWSPVEWTRRDKREEGVVICAPSMVVVRNGGIPSRAALPLSLLILARLGALLIPCSTNMHTHAHIVASSWPCAGQDVPPRSLPSPSIVLCRDVLLLPSLGGRRRRNDLVRCGAQSGESCLVTLADDAQRVVALNGGHLVPV